MAAEVEVSVIVVMVLVSVAALIVVSSVNLAVVVGNIGATLLVREMGVAEEEVVSCPCVGTDVDRRGLAGDENWIITYREYSPCHYYHCKIHGW